MPNFAFVRKKCNMNAYNYNSIIWKERLSNSL